MKTSTDEKRLKVKIIHRGWPGHFICAPHCLFRLNTLISSDHISIVVSTVGRMMCPIRKEIVEIGAGRYYETMAFIAGDDEFRDAEVSKQVYFESPWMIGKDFAENEANAMHGAVVKELSEKILNGESIDVEEN